MILAAAPGADHIVVVTRRRMVRFAAVIHSARAFGIAKVRDEAVRRNLRDLELVRRIAQIEPRVVYRMPPAFGRVWPAVEVPSEHAAALAQRMRKLDRLHRAPSPLVAIVAESLREDRERVLQTRAQCRIGIVGATGPQRTRRSHDYVFARRICSAVLEQHERFVIVAEQRLEYA